MIDFERAKSNFRVNVAIGIQRHVKHPHNLVRREPRRPRLHLPRKAESDRAVVLGKGFPGNGNPKR